MAFKSTSSSLVLVILLLALNYKTHSAPTHHLTVRVHGNTPTLIVTSSEVGIKSKSVGSSKKFAKAEYATKTFKDLNTPKKLVKVKLDKNPSSFSKMDKLQYLAKASTIETLTQDSSFRAATSLENKEKVNKFLLKKQPTNAAVKRKFKTTTSFPVTAESYNTDLQYTTSHPAPQVNTAQPEGGSPMSSQATTSTPTISNNNLNVSPALSTISDPKDFEDSSTTINYNGGTNAFIVSDNSTKTNTQTEANANVVVVPVQKTKEVLKDTSVIKTQENVDDSGRYEHESIIAVTENENPLLSTMETKAFNIRSTPAAISVPTLVTLATGNTEATATSLTMAATMTTTTTEDVVDDNNSNNGNEQPTATVYVERVVLGPSLKTSNQNERNKEAEAEKTYSHLKPTEIPRQAIVGQTTAEPLLSHEFPPLRIQNETATETKTTFALEFNHDSKEATTTSPDQAYEITAPATTEGILKLIDLEKHVVKTIDELKQSPLLRAGQHDNGHDGLKNIKKKQLVDKHYVEALLHNKEDVHIKHLSENEQYLLQTNPPNMGRAHASPTSHLTIGGNKSLLLPIKRGYLGPILMEEKTFHVIHHTGIGTTGNSHHDDGKTIDSQLRKGHFVELKVKTEGPNIEKDDTREAKLSINGNEKSSSTPEDKQKLEKIFKNLERNGSLENTTKVEEATFAKGLDFPAAAAILGREQEHSSIMTLAKEDNKKNKEILESQTSSTNRHLKDTTTSNPTNLSENPEANILESTTGNSLENTFQTVSPQLTQTPQKQSKQPAIVLSTTVFQAIDSVATKIPMLQADTLFTSADKESSLRTNAGKEKTESKISDIQIEVYDSTVDSIVASTNFKDVETKSQSVQARHDESYLGKTTKPPIATIQQERFTQYVIDRMETSTQEPINYSTIQVASGRPEPAAIEIHINVSESFGSDSEDSEFSYPQTEFNNKYNNNNNERMGEVAFDDSKVHDDIKLKIPSNLNGSGKELRNDEILVVEIIDSDNNTATGKSKNTDELFITDVKDIYNTPPPPPPPPPYQTNFDRDSDTIFYISNTEVKVGETLPVLKATNEERKLKLESQFFPANYMASTHPSLNNGEGSNPTHHLYEEDIILSSRHNQADALKIYRNNNEPSPPLDVTYVGESIIEVEQSPELVATTTYAPDQQHNAVTPQADVIIQPAILPEISIGVPVIGELPPQIELKEIDFMPNEAQLHPSGIYDDNDNSNNKNNNINIFSNDIDETTINGSNNNHDADVVSGNGNNNNQRVDDSSIQYGGDLIDESADGGFDGVEGSYPFGNPAALKKSSSSSYSTGLPSRLRKQQRPQPNHVADYAHLYVNYGVNNMRKDELSADVKDSGEMLLIGSSGNEQNATTFKDFLNKVGMSNSTIPFMSANSTQSERMSNNATAFSVMEDANDLDDKSTEDIINLISLAIGLFIVILPVVVTCSMFWALRYLYKKYHSNLMDNGAYTDQMETKAPLNEDGVEKGEDISRVARETKMDYNKDGVFVVEVARGIDSKTIPESPVTEGNEKVFSMFEIKQKNGGLNYKMTNEKNCVNNERVQIHSPPPENQEEGPRSLHQIEEVEEPINSPNLTDHVDRIADLVCKANTGLSQSDLSSTSSSDSNKGYNYGNQELYVLEKKGCSNATPTGNVVLKCAVKDIEDDDRNPGNDHYLKHSPDKKEELTKDKKDIMETTEKSKEGGSRTSSGVSPEQKQDDTAEEKVENILKMQEGNERDAKVIEKGSIGEQLEECDNDVKPNVDAATKSPNEMSEAKPKLSIAVEIEVHTTPAQHEDSTKDKTLTRNKFELTESSLLEETQTAVQALILNNHQQIEDIATLVSEEKEDVENNESDKIAAEAVLESSPDHKAHQDNLGSIKTIPEREHDENITNTVEHLEKIKLEPVLEDIESKENELGENREKTLQEFEKEHTKGELLNGLEDSGTLKNEEQESNMVIENCPMTDKNIVLQVNGSASTEETELSVEDEEQNIFNTKEDVYKLESLNGRTQSKLLTNGTATLIEIITGPEEQETQNGLAEDVEHINSSLNEMENGYDSILSLPEPPPTTNEELNSDISDQQLDSLPPPPPPEIFNFKDLSPPLTNGKADFLQSEESTNFYNTLPPQPPNAIEVTASAETTTTNGKLHASPLTPPASPPAHFTNNLHAGLCPLPIAVDVNGS